MKTVEVNIGRTATPLKRGVNETGGWEGAMALRLKRCVNDSGLREGYSAMLLKRIDAAN